MKDFLKFIENFASGQILNLNLFMFFSIMAGLLEFIGIFAVYPFILMIVSPKMIMENPVFYRIFDTLGISNFAVITIFLAVFITFIFIFKNLMMVFMVMWQTKFSIRWKNIVSNRFMGYYLFADYKECLKIYDADKIYNTTVLCNQAIDDFVFRVLSLVSNFIILFIILSLLVVKFPYSTFITALFIALALVLQNDLFKKRTAEIAKKFSDINEKVNEKIIENINHLKEIKIFEAQQIFFNKYLAAKNDFVDLNYSVRILNLIPPYFIEIIIVFTLIILIGLISLQVFTNPTEMIASYALIVTAFFRMAPILGRIQTAFNHINSSREFIKKLNNEYEKFNFEKMDTGEIEEIKFTDKIILKDVNFAYDDINFVLKDINLEIKKGEFVGIVGTTGCGKSTLLDIIMGLLPINLGEILIDGENVDFRALRKLVGYVPQQINLLHTSLRNNVAFGRKIDDLKIIEALEQAQIDISNFEGGLDFDLKINGLSQGQKQRIAIARAIYHNSEILILDEATSALDNETEGKLMQIIDTFRDKKTIIAVAHRLSTLKNCDKIINLENGKIVKND